MSSVLHRSPETPPRADSVYETCYRTYTNPKNDIEDISSGAGVACLGLQENDVVANMHAQLRDVPYAHSAQWTTNSVEQAAEVMVNAMGPAFKGGACVFYSSGAEAVEAACKIATQFAVVRGSEGSRFIGRQHSYHGNTVFALALGDHPRKNNLSALGINLDTLVRRVPTPSPEFYPGQSIYQILTATSAAAEGAQALGRAPVILIEPIGGTTIGISAPPVEYFTGLASIRKHTGAILIYDEVLCGNWRTGHCAAWQYYQQTSDVDISPDIVVMGKGIAGGYFPISCVIVKKTVRNAVEFMGRLWHTSTNQNHPVGCQGVVAAQTAYNDCSLSDLFTKLDHEVVPALRALDQVHWVTGVGALWGIQLDPMIPGLHQDAQTHLREKGFAVYTDGGTVMKTFSAAQGNMILLAPPFNMDPAVLDDFVEALSEFQY